MEIIREALEGARQRILEGIQKAAAAGDAERISQLSIELAQAERILAGLTVRVETSVRQPVTDKPADMGSLAWFTGMILAFGQRVPEFTRDDLVKEAEKYSSLFPEKVTTPYPSDMERGVPRWHRWVSNCLIDLQRAGRVEKIGTRTYRCSGNVKP